MTLAASVTPLQLALALDVVVDAPTVRECADLMRELRGIGLSDVWQSGEYVVQRDDVTGCDTVRFLRGSHIRGEWVVGNDEGVTSANRLAAVLRAIHAELVGTGITTGWLREGLLCDAVDDETPSVEPCYDAFEAFLQEGLWANHKVNCTPAASCTSYPGTSSSRAIFQPSRVRSWSTEISRAHARKSLTRSATKPTGATCGASAYPTRSCVRAGHTKALPGCRNRNSRSTNQQRARRRTGTTATVGAVGRNWRTRGASENWRSRARKFGSGNVMAYRARQHVLPNKMNHRLHADFQKFTMTFVRYGKSVV